MPVVLCPSFPESVKVVARESSHILSSKEITMSTEPPAISMAQYKAERTTVE